MEEKRKFSTKAEEDLILVTLALKKKDQQAYAKLMSKYRDSIYYIVLKMVHNRDDAEDLTIEAFGKAFHYLEKYNSEYAFSTWLYKIATNNCIDFIRKKRLETSALYMPSDDNDEMMKPIDISSGTPDPEETYIREQRGKLMREVVDTLNPKYRELIVLRFFKELSYEEIAVKLKLPLGSVKAQLFRAKELLFNILKNEKEHY